MIIPLDASVDELLVSTIAALGMGSFFAFDLPHRATHSFFPEVAQASSLRSQLRARSVHLLLHVHFRSAGSWSSHIVLVAVLLAPALVLSASTHLAHNRDRSRPIPVAAPATLPAYPTSLPSQVIWIRDIPAALGVTTEAAGPLVLTDDSLISLDPSTGKTHWDCHRQGKKFAQYREHVNGVLGERPYLITSPDRRHIVPTLGEMEFQDKSSGSDLEVKQALTVVPDTVTGRIANERPHDGKAVQLTNSMLLAGNTVYSPTDDSMIWQLGNVDLGLSEEGSTYTDTAGYANLILAGKIPGNPNGIGLFTLVLDINPCGIIRDVPAAYANQRLLIIEGWTVTCPRSTQNELDDADWNYSRAHRTQTIPPDVLAKMPGADTHAYNLGQALGITPMMSSLSGRLAVLPETVPDPAEPSESRFPDTWKDRPTVATTLNPRTRVVLAASQDPGFVTAVGVIRIDDGQECISFQSGDKSRVTSIPLGKGTVSFVPGTGGSNTGLDDFLVNEPGGNGGISALSAPGVTVVPLHPTYKNRSTGTRLCLYRLAWLWQLGSILL